jgi:hypothetical protein
VDVVIRTGLPGSRSGIPVPLGPDGDVAGH